MGYCLFWMSSRLSSSIRLVPFETFLLDVDDSFRFHLLDTLRLFSIFGFQGTDSFLWMFPSSGDGEIRTLDPLLARQVLSQLSYAPIWVTYLIIQSHSASGLEKTRTSDLTLIRRAL